MSITKNCNNFVEKNIKIKLNSDDELPLNKTTIEIPIIAIAVRSSFTWK